MSVRLRDLATGVAGCALLTSAGCRRPSAAVTTPGEGEPLAGQSSAPTPECPEPDEHARAPAPGSSGDRLSPQVVGGSFVASDRVRLEFSEAIGPVDQVNPRQFRISYAYSVVEMDEGYASAYYEDPGGTDTTELSMVVIGLETYEGRPEILGLTFNQPVPPAVCLNLEDMEADAGDVDPGMSEEAGLFLHYTGRGSEGVQDLSGNPLQDFGAEWALHFGVRNKQSYGDDPVVRFDLLVALPCPVGLAGTGPPGPS